jgi:hypothetical protein
MPTVRRATLLISLTIFCAPAAAQAAAPRFDQKPVIRGSGHAGDRLTCSWSFTDPGDVSDQEAQMVAVQNDKIVRVLAFGDSSPLHYTPGGDEGHVGCRVRAQGQPDSDGNRPTAQAVAPLRKIIPPLAITARGMKPQTVAEIESKGFAAQGECNRACALTLKVVLGRRDARRLGIGRKATAIGFGKGRVRSGKASVRARVKHLAKLNHAGFVHLTLRLGGVAKNGDVAPAIILTKMRIRFHA